eukprot:353765-Chlamydomonas_euryale.AAC.1
MRCHPSPSTHNGNKQSPQPPGSLPHAPSFPLSDVFTATALHHAASLMSSLPLPFTMLLLFAPPAAMHAPAQ